MKYIDFKRYKFSTVLKKIDTIKHNFLGFFKFINVRRYNFRRILRHLDFKEHSFNLIPKKINFKKYTYLPIYFLFSVILVGLVYLIIPTFYKYDKSNLEKSLCKNKNIECFIEGKVSYSFYPTPRIKIKDLVINEFFEKKNTLITTKDVAIKLSFKNLINKKRLIYKKIDLNDFEINLDLKKLNRYKNVFKKNIY